MVEVGHTDSPDASVLHIADLRLVVAGDAIYNGVHMYLGASVAVRGFGLWRNPIDKIQALNPRHIIAGHQNKQLDDDAKRVIAETQVREPALRLCTASCGTPCATAIRVPSGCSMGRSHRTAST
jgi:glyoxylase-like metal-dependent hydrolase (beta-lactamase superfamily II)